MTEKISRRGYHLSREYSLDPLEILFVKEVMRTNVVVLPSDQTLEEAYHLIRSSKRPKGQQLFPVVGAENELVGVVTRSELIRLHEEMGEKAATTPLSDIAAKNPHVACVDEPLRAAMDRMAETGLTRFPVLEPGNGGKIAGMVALGDLLQARTRNLEDERARERVLRIRMPFGSPKKETGRQG